MQLDNLSDIQWALLIAMVVWDTTLKGFALWRAAQNDSKGWFVALMVINSVGILPIIYLLLSKSTKSAKS